MALAPEDIVNQGLRRIGYETPVGFMFEGSRASRVALEIYGQTRDDLLGNQHWPFARRDLTLTLLKTAPVGGYSMNPWTTASPPPPWIYEYAYPSDCIEVRNIRETPIFIPSFDPKPNLWTLFNDSALGQKAILTNVAGAILVYTGQITDLTVWDSNALEALVEALGRRFVSALAADPNLFKENAGEEQASERMAIASRG